MFWIEQRLSRKLVHILSGLLFALSWPIFRYSFAANETSLNPLKLQHDCFFSFMFN